MIKKGLRFISRRTFLSIFVFSFILLTNICVYAETSVDDSLKIDILQLIPLREVFEHLQYEVRWNSENKSVEVRKNDDITLFVNDRSKVDLKNKIYYTYFLNGTSYITTQELEYMDYKYEYLNNNKISIKEKINHVPIIESGAFKEEELMLLNEKGMNKLLFFWTTWCPYCTKLIAELNKMNLDGLDLEIIAVNIEDESQEEKVLRYIATNMENFNNILDPNKIIFNLYGGRVIPTTFFINKNNEIIGTIKGAYNEEEINSYFNFE